MSKILSTVIYAAQKLCGVHGEGVRILCYHRVNYHEKKYTTVSVEHFCEQMRYLAEHGYRTISLKQLLHKEDQRPQTKDSKVFSLRSSVFGRTQREIIITFDDGYRDIYQNAFPIMKQYGFTGCVFCMSDEIGKESFLTKSEILEMHQAGFEFGSHTMSHGELPHLDDKSKWLEISESKQRLEQMLEMPIPYFCYPRGLYDAQTVEYVKRAGYLAACSNRPGTNMIIGNQTIDYRPKTTDQRLKEKNVMHLVSGLWSSVFSLSYGLQSNIREVSDSFLLQRTEIGGFDDLGDFQRKLAGAYDFLHAALHWMRGRP